MLSIRSRQRMITVCGGKRRKEKRKREAVRINTQKRRVGEKHTVQALSCLHNPQGGRESFRTRNAYCTDEQTIHLPTKQNKKGGLSLEDMTLLKKKKGKTNQIGKTGINEQRSRQREIPIKDRPTEERTGRDAGNGEVVGSVDRQRSMFGDGGDGE
jgi:hypothetical protein